MSRNFAVLNKSGPEGAPRSAAETSATRAEYGDLISRLFHGPAVVALVRSAPGEAVRNVCNEVGSELGLAGRRVIVVSVETVLRISPVSPPDENEFTTGASRNLWHWPLPKGPQIDFFKPHAWGGEGNWLESLRARFDSVVLDCPELDLAPGAAAIAAMADAAVLVVQAGQTSKQRIVLDLRALELNGARVVGSVLINGK